MISPPGETVSGVEWHVDDESAPTNGRPAPGTEDRPFPVTRLLLAILAGKMTVLLIVFLAYELLPFSTEAFEANFVDPDFQHVSLASAFSTWDAQHYLYLSSYGYQPGQMSNAFFPLFPLLIRLATGAVHDQLLAGFIVANLASLIGLYLLFELIRELHGRDVARNSLLLYLAFPTAFFLSLIYTESLYLLLVSSFFLLLFRGRLGWAAIPAALLPLARPEGVLIVLPLAVYYLVERTPLGLRLARPVHRRSAALPSWDEALSDPRLLAVASPALGAASYLAFMKLATGNPFEMFQAMQSYVSAHSLSYVLHPLQLARVLGEWPLDVHGFTNSAIDRLFFLLFLGLLVPLFQRVHPALAVYGLMVGVLNVISGTFMSYSRYLLLAFPVFIAAAILLSQPRTRWALVPLTYTFVMVQGLFVTMHALGYWVA